jgi:hypothetical protein
LITYDYEKLAAQQEEVTGSQFNSDLAERAIEIVRTKGIDVPPSLVEKLYSAVRNTERFIAAAKSEGAETEALLNQNLWDEVAHPISKTHGSEGIPFPDTSQMIWEPVPPVSNTAQTNQPQSIVIPTPTPYRFPPPRCSKDETIAEVFDQKNEEYGVRIDKIFLAEELVPLDQQEVFGATVELIPYGPNSDPTTATLMRIYSVPCLPFRIRITKNTRFTDTGGNALKNYDHDYNGKGIWHPLMFEKWFPGKKAPPFRPPSKRRGQN